MKKASEIKFNPEQLRGRISVSEDDLLDGRGFLGNYGLAGADAKHINHSPKRYTFIDNGAKILAVAHVDTVGGFAYTFSKATLSGKTVYFSPSMDDRLGVYTILDVLPSHGVKYDVLLTTDEERGMSTAEEFVPPIGKAYNWIFEFDRKGTGAVFYQYDGSAISDAAKPFFTHELGSFSDISLLDTLGCGGMNVGTGYEFEHTYYCHMVVENWQEQVSRFLKFWKKYKDIHLTYTYNNRNSYRGYSHTVRDMDEPIWKVANLPKYATAKDWYKAQSMAKKTQIYNDWKLDVGNADTDVIDYLRRHWKWYHGGTQNPANTSASAVEKTAALIQRTYSNESPASESDITIVSPDALIREELGDNPTALTSEVEKWNAYKADRDRLRHLSNPDGLYACDRCDEPAEYVTYMGEHLCRTCDDTVFWTEGYTGSGRWQY